MILMATTDRILTKMVKSCLKNYDGKVIPPYLECIVRAQVEETLKSVRLLTEEVEEILWSAMLYIEYKDGYIHWTDGVPDEE